MRQNPLEYFKELYRKENAQAQAKIPGACCVSTIGIDGYPNARFLALKDINDKGFIITGPLSTRKGDEINSVPKVSLTFWWPIIEVQIRIQGNADKISPELASKYFHERPRESQLTSWASRQGQPLDNPASLIKKLEEIELQFQDKEIPCPKDWGGFCVIPKRIEFLEFSNERLHTRILYTNEADKWTTEYLQP